jgi:hypothetical protein
MERGMLEREFEIEGNRVTFELGKGWRCSCTNVYVESLDLSLRCFHWPVCEHIVKAARLDEPMED